MALQPINDDFENVDDEDLPEDGNDDEPEPVAPPPPPPPKNKGGRPRKNPPSAQGAAAAANAPKPLAANAPDTWPTEAEQIWPLLLDWLKAGAGTGSPIGPEAVRINILRLSSGYTPGPPMPLSPSIEGEMVAGDEARTPGEALREHITEYYHLFTSKGPARYKVHFTWRHNGKGIRAGDMACPSPHEIQALRAAQEYRRQKQEQQDGPPNYRPPQPQSRPPYPGMGAPPYPFPGPQYPQYPYASQPDQELQYELARAREREAALNAKLDSALQAINDLREGRQPAVQPTVTAPATSKSEVVTAVVDTLVRLGVIGPDGKPAGVGAAPAAAASAPAAAAPVGDPLAAVEATLTAFGRLKKMSRMVDQLAGDAVEATAEPIVEDPAATKDEGLPWTAKETGGFWPDKSPIRFAQKKNGGGIDWTGVLFENGWAGQKIMEVGETVLRPIGEAAQKIAGGMVTQVPPVPQSTTEHQAEVVNGIPTGAREVPAS